MTIATAKTLPDDYDDLTLLDYRTILAWLAHQSFLEVIWKFAFPTISRMEMMGSGKC